jgi:hypothetical protein
MAILLRDRLHPVAADPASSLLPWLLGVVLLTSAMYYPNLVRIFDQA